MVEPVNFEDCNIITIQGKQDNNKPKTPFVLRAPTSHTIDNKYLQYYPNVVTCSRAKLVLKGPMPSTPDLEQKKDKTLASPSGKGAKLAKNLVATSYNVLDQLK